MNERVGIFGGTFDPVHAGHIAVAAQVRHACELDRVLLVVAGEPWQKVGTGDLPGTQGALAGLGASATERLAMVRAGTTGIAGIEASSIEVDRPGPSYTVETLRELAVPGRDLFLIVGADVAAKLETWHEYGSVAELATLVIASRIGDPGVEPSSPPWRVRYIEVSRLDISSTDLRSRLGRGLPVDGLIPPAVMRVIQERGLYSHS